MFVDEIVKFFDWANKDKLSGLIDAMVERGYDIDWDGDGYFIGEHGDVGNMLAKLHHQKAGVEERILELIDAGMKNPDKLPAIIEKFEAGTEMTIKQLVEGKPKKSVEAKAKNIIKALLGSGG